MVPLILKNRHGSRVSWGRYNTDNGETRPAWCDVDGDGKHELVIGLGQGGSGWLQIRDDANTGYAHLAWVRVPWGNYNTSNGETFPACGDLDGDEKDEIVIGLGNGGKGWVLVLEDADAGYSVKRWLQVNWSSYNSKNGTVHPAVGNVDGDAEAEIVLGLGSDGAGWLQILDDASHGFTSLKWVRESWKNYNTANGETRPALCDVDGDGHNELVIGLGKGGLGYLKVLDDVASGSASLGWPQIPWSAYNSSNGGTYPTCGDVDSDGRDELIVGLGDGGKGYFKILDDHGNGFASMGWKRGHWGSYNSAGGAIHPAMEKKSKANDAIQFDMAGATSLQALEDVVTEASPNYARQRQASGKSLFTYKIASDAAKHVQSHAASTDSVGTNLLAVDSDGDTRLAVVASHPVQVMFMVTDSEGKYVYLALDPNQSKTVIAETNCAIYRVTLANNAFSCVLEGNYLQDIDNEFVQRLGGNQKPIQLDADGNVYFAATPFTITGDTIDIGSWRPIIYRYNSNDRSLKPITHDALAIRFFLVLKSGDVVYQGANSLNGQEKLWMYQDGASIDLTSTPPSLFMRDTYKNLFWLGEDNAQKPGLWFARTAEGGGVHRAFLRSTAYQNYSSSPDQITVSDNGRLYGVFSASGVGVMVQQMLPYSEAPVVKFDYPGGGLRHDIPVQVAKGYLFYVDKVSAGMFGTKDVIRKVRLADGQIENLLEDKNLDKRYEIFAWRLSGHDVYFSGLEKSTTTLVTGRIDTLNLDKSVEEYLTITPVASALGAASVVKDIEILVPVIPPSDPGSSPIGILRSSTSNPTSISVEFTKHMNNALVEEGTHVLNDAEQEVPFMSVWFYKALHLIPDLDETGLGDGEGSMPLTSGVGYTMNMDGARDRYGQNLVDLNDQLGLHVTLAIGENGSEPSPVNVEPVAGGLSPSLAEGLVAYYPFNGNANDESGNGNDGVENNGIVYVEGKFEQAAEFNGTSSYISVPHNDRFNLQNMTISFWVYDYQHQNGNSSVIILKGKWSKGEIDQKRQYAISTNYGDSGLTRFNILDSGEQWQLLDSQKRIQTDQWTHIIATYDGSTMKLFLNGQIEASSLKIFDAFISSFPEPLTIGAGFEIKPDGSEEMHHEKSGLIDDIRIYNRALSESEIQELYTTSANTTTSITTNADTPYTGTLPASDKDGDSLFFSIVGNPSHGSVVFTDASTGEFVYTPDVNYSGTDSFTYMVNDGNMDSEVATVTVTIK